MLPENLSSSENQEKEAKSNSPSTAGFVMERRRYHLKEAELDSNTTSSLKRFQKHISTSIKAGKKTGRQFTIARIAILEIGNLSESSEFGLAKSLDAHCKEHIVGQLRKSDRLFSNMLGEYLVLMPNTDLDICKKAVTRIAESLADSTFQKGPFTICPSSKASYVTWTQSSELSATELISSLGYGPPAEDQEEDSLETESNGIVKLFTGDFSGWFSRYELEPDFDTVKSVEDSELDLLNYVGRDTWSSGRVVLMRVLYHPEGKLRISPETKHSILQFLRQVQSLGNATVVSSGLLDFHIHDNRIYLVNTVPEFVDDLTLLKLPVFSQLKVEGQSPISFRHVLLKLCGSIAYLKSLVPPVALDRFSSLVILVAGAEVPEGVHLLNHELPTLLRLISGEDQDLFRQWRDADTKLKSHSTLELGYSKAVEEFLRFVIRLSEKLEANPALADEARETESIIRRLIQVESQGEPDGSHAPGLTKYNNFSKLKELFKS